MSFLSALQTLLGRAAHTYTNDVVRPLQRFEAPVTTPLQRFVHSSGHATADTPQIGRPAFSFNDITHGNSALIGGHTFNYAPADFEIHPMTFAPTNTTNLSPTLDAPIIQGPYSRPALQIPNMAIPKTLIRQRIPSNG